MGSHDVGQVAAGTSNKPTATVTLYDTDGAKESCVAAIGTGPVDAAYKAIDELLGTHGTRLMEYSVARCGTTGVSGCFSILRFLWWSTPSFCCGQALFLSS